MLRLKQLAVALALSLVFAAGCAAPIKDGEVIDKTFVPAHVEDDTILVPDGNGGFTTIPTWTHVPDEWFLTIQKKTEDGTVRTRSVKVNRFTHDRIKTGEWYNVE